MKLDFANKVAVVTGGAGGIGHAMARRFADAGAKVVLADLTDDTPAMRENPFSARFLRADISTEAGVLAMLRDVEAHEGAVDIFASNAGIAQRMDITASEDDWQRMMNINLMSHVWAARHLVPQMAERGGQFIVTASAAGLLNEVNSIGYGVTKHGAVGFAEWLAFHYADTPLQVFCLCPEGVQTPLIEEADYLKPRAVTPALVADKVIAAMKEQQFMITTHDSTLKGLAVKASDYDKFIGYMAKVSADEKARGG
ncbi:SDR family NAD(P)-dependent oxidoreductase [Actibacterium lipolyticum]|uniref:D-beta-hydroxybutyrate dehydrogenase n=1 Tax=Actibacterium lipolyticum TaxID=1524263 RepID=A0A238KN99_9RHOB|nr:SDR family oxidoreductase [Actibacterium lipolyticum]SMX44294.1 D-beta-hydroxybutyrate dehydrogenase [Actibacterium lipolyticum]